PIYRGPEHHRHERGRARRPAERARLVRVLLPEPAAFPDRRREPDPAAPPDQAVGAAVAGHRPGAAGGPVGAPRQHAHRPVPEPAAAGRRRPRHDHQPGGDPGRRPGPRARPAQRGRGAGPARLVRARARRQRPAGQPRPDGGRLRRPDGAAEVRPRGAGAGLPGGEGGLGTCRSPGGLGGERPVLMWPLILRNLRHRRNAFASAFVAMAVAAAVVSACAALAATGARAAVPPYRLAGALVVVVGDQTLARADERVWLPEKVRLPGSAAAALRAVPGVAAVVEDVTFPAVTAGAAALGQDWATARLGPYGLRAGTPPARPGEVVLDAELAARGGTRVGGQADVEVHGVTARYTVTGLAAATPGGPATRPAVFFSAADARRLSGHPGTSDALAVLPAPGLSAAELEQRVSDALAELDQRVSGTLAGLEERVRAVTLTGDERGLAEFPGARQDAGDLAVVSAALGAMTLLATTPLVAGVLGSVAAGRRRELLILRTLGVPRARVRLMLLGEVAVLAAAATLAGSIPGPHLARWLFDRMVAAGVVAAPVVFDPAPVALSVAALACLAAGLVAAYITAHRVCR